MSSGSWDQGGEGQTSAGAFDPLAAHEDAVLAQIFRSAIAIVETGGSNVAAARAALGPQGVSPPATDAPTRDELIELQEQMTPVARFEALETWVHQTCFALAQQLRKPPPPREAPVPQLPLGLLTPATKALDRPVNVRVALVAMVAVMATSGALTFATVASQEEKTRSEIARASANRHDVGAEAMSRLQKVEKSVSDLVNRPRIAARSIPVGQNGADACGVLSLDCLSVTAGGDADSNIQLPCAAAVVEAQNCAGTFMSVKEGTPSAKGERRARSRSVCLSSEAVALCAAPKGSRDKDQSPQ